MFQIIKKFKSKIALIDEYKGKISYQDLEKDSEKISNKIKNKSLIFIVGNNCLEWICGYIGFLKNNHVILLVDEKMEEKSFFNLVKKFKPNFIYKHKKMYKSLNQKKKIRYKDYDLIEIYKLRHNFHPKLSLLLNTSGTMGNSKYVRISLENLIVNSNSIIKYLKIKQKDRLLTLLSPSYSFGLSMINTHILKGCTLILNNNSIIEKEFWNKLETNKATTFGGVPFVFEIINKIGISKYNISSLKYVTQAGGAMSGDLFQKIHKMFKKKKIKFLTMYGQTEASPRMSYLPYKYNLKKRNCIGIPISGGKFSLVNKYKKEIKETNIIGELVYEGKNVSLGYAESAEDFSKEDLNNGKLFTGDLAYKDNDNFFYITCRQDRLVKLFGYRINLDDLENSLNENGLLVVCKKSQNKLNIFYTDQSKIINLKQKVFSLTKLNQNFINFKMIKSIPRNSSGKIKYNQIN